MKRKILTTLMAFLIVLNVNNIFAQTTIMMQKEDGVYLIPCKVNGLNLKFIFDTGASDVSISLTEALFMLKNDYLNSEDILGNEYYTDATGDISTGTKIILRKIEFSGLTLTNVEASVVHDLSAPLLLGQTAMAQLGKFQLDPNKGILTILDQSNNTSSYTDAIKTTQTQKIDPPTTIYTDVSSAFQTQNSTINSTSITSNHSSDTVANNYINHHATIPDDSSKIVLLCNQLYLNNKYSECIQLYDILIQKFPSYGICYYNRGLAKYFSNNFIGAQADWNKAILLGIVDAQVLLSKYFTK